MVKKAQAKPKKRPVATGGRTRQLTKKQARQKSKQKAKEEAGKQAPMPGSFKLLAQSYSVFKNNWKTLGGIVLVYGLLNIVFSSGLFSDLNNAISGIRQTHDLSTALSSYGSLLSLGSTSGNAQAASSAAESVLLILESLVIIWALRQLIAGQKIAVKQAYYQSMAPLIPFLLVILMMIVQLLPLTFGAAFLGIVLTSAIITGTFLTVIFSICFALLATWTIYMISASAFALYIVTLPDMEPRQALRSAKNLVRFRRWSLLRRLFFLPLFIILALGIVMVPLIVLLPYVVPPVFFILLMLSILFAHTYLYSLYRGLIE